MGDEFTVLQSFGKFEKTFWGIGSNLGDREKNLEQALEHLAGHAKIAIRRLSSIFETEPVGFREQPTFLNAVIELETAYNPIELLSVALGVEQAMGRVRNVFWGPRIIDLDLLLYGTERLQTTKLTIPHPRIAERRFVLAPLHELAPELMIPGLDENVRTLLNKCPDRSRVSPYTPKRINWELSTFES